MRWILLAVAFAALALPGAAHATFPGQNGKIAFSNFDLSSDTWLVISMNPDGSGQTTLRTGLQPEWSPDGRDLLFVHQDDIRRMPADGSSETTLLDAPGLMPNGFRSWQTPAWSPDGSRIAASFINGDEPDNFFTELHTASSADGSARQRIAYGQSPSWRPDGSLIAFSAHSFNGNPGELHLVHPDGTGEDSIVEPFGLEPDYSPDGTKIVYSAYPAGGSVREIYVYRGSGTSPLRLTNNTDHDGDPVWSPTGTKIAFRSDREGESAIYTMNADGTNPTRITIDPDYQAEPSWQPIPYPRYVRPKGATPVRVPLVPAFEQCTAPNREHGPPLAFGSCTPPAQESGELTVGTSMTGFVRYKTMVGNPATPADEADIALRVQITDVREQGTLADYAGEVEAEATARLTDREAGIPGTATDMTFPLTTQCTPTAATNVGSTCSLNTTLDALIPDAIAEDRRTILQLGQVQVVDGGPDADTATEPNNVFLRQGVFVP